MKQILLIIALVCAGNCYGQYHVKVIPNPNNGGFVSAHWVNNYVVSYTTDNWKHHYELFHQETYMGYDNDYNKYYISYYEVHSFNGQADAISFASKFTTLNKVRRYDSLEMAKHSNLNKQFTEDVKHKNFKPIPNKKVKDVSIL